MEQTRPPDPLSRTAPAQERTRTDPAQPASARPAAQPAAQSSVQVTPPENLTITPTLAGPETASLVFDWEAVAMGSNRSYACAVSALDGAPLSVTLTQGLYRRTYNGDRIVKTGPVPPALPGTDGSLAARKVSSGESVTYAWRWQPKSSAGTTAGPAPSRAGLLARLFSRAKADTQGTSAGLKRRRPTVAALLGPRAAQAFTLKFFGQEATGQRFAFILDQSGSMHGARWKACTAHLIRALRVMPPHVEFAVVLFECQLHEPPRQSGWLKAEPGEIEAVISWLATQRPGGGNRETPAFQRVFSFSAPPDVIYFLTDGLLADFGPDTCERVRGAAQTIIHTIALENDAGREVLVAIAEQTGGEFVLISTADEGGA